MQQCEPTFGLIKSTNSTKLAEQNSILFEPDIVLNINDPVYVVTPYFLHSVVLSDKFQLSCSPPPPPPPPQVVEMVVDMQREMYSTKGGRREGGLDMQREMYSTKGGRREGGLDMQREMYSTKGGRREGGLDMQREMYSTKGGRREGGLDMQREMYSTKGGRREGGLDMQREMYSTKGERYKVCEREKSLEISCIKTHILLSHSLNFHGHPPPPPPPPPSDRISLLLGLACVE